MRYLFILFALIAFNLTSWAQFKQPVKWSTEYKQVNGLEFDLIFHATMEEGWAVYSQYTDEGGPVPTSFSFDKGKHFKLVGKVKEEGHKKEGKEPLFDNINVVKFVDGHVAFTQRVQVKEFGTPITGYLEFMTCNDEICLPPTEEDFSFTVKAAEVATATKPVEGKKKEAVAETPKAVVQTPSGPSTVAEKPIAEVTPKITASKEATSSVVLSKEENSKTTSDINTIAALPPARDLSFSGAAQQGIGGGNPHPAQWTLEVKKLGEQEYELAFKTELCKGWHIYSHFLGDEGPIPTNFYFGEAGPQLVGELKESGSKREVGYEEVFDMEVIKYKKDAQFVQQIKVEDSDKIISGYIEYMTCEEGMCIPFETEFKIDLLAAKGALDNGAPCQNGADQAAIAGEKPLNNCGKVASIKEAKGLWGIFILGLLAGFVALLTPCVFPMIPLTVSFFTKSSENKKKGISNAVLYGAFIFLVYILLSIPFHLMDSINSDILNEISTNPWLNIIFFLVFVFFAFSFFGYYELTIPSSWTNKISSAENIGGVIGIFFMALTLALVSFSCTGPILGTLLAGAISSTGGAMQLTSGMAGFGFALALPFAVFAAFPSLMNALPKSGGWLNTVKVVLGFVELGLAFKFLSNADLVEHWGLLKIEPFLGIWIILSLGTALYLFGKIKFPHDSPLKKLSFGRISTGLLFLAFAAYLMSGFRYQEETKTFAPLKILSGVAPPVGYSLIYPNDCPNNLDCFKDYEEGLAYAKKVNKPVMIDFTGYACVNCRKMEEHVWSKTKILNSLKKDFVLISLYTDDKKALPKEEQGEVIKQDGKKKRMRNYGHKWSLFQEEKFQAIGQPYYVLLSPDGEKQLTNPVGYTPDVDEFAGFLDCGLDAFQKMRTLGER